jgi:DNA-binding MarR family transcriptional regulator
MSEEIRKIERECVALRVRMLSRVITGIYDEAFAKLGMKVSQFTVLMAVFNREKTRPAALAKLLHMDESTVSRNVERMRVRGWLRLKPDSDGRSHLITLTEKGTALIQKGYPAWLKAQGEVTQRLGEEGIAALRSISRKLRA